MADKSSFSKKSQPGKMDSEDEHGSKDNKDVRDSQDNKDVRDVQSNDGISRSEGAAPPHNALAAFVLDMDRVEAKRAAATGQPAGNAHGEGNTPRRRSLTPDAIAAYAEAYDKYVQAEERLIAAQERQAEARARRAAHRVRLRRPFYSVERPTGRVLVIFAIAIMVILGAGFIVLLVCAVILAFAGSTGNKTTCQHFILACWAGRLKETISRPGKSAIPHPKQSNRASAVLCPYLTFSEISIMARFRVNSGPQ